MKRLYYLPALPKRKVQPLIEGILSYFRHSVLRVEFDHTNSQLEIEWASSSRAVGAIGGDEIQMVATLDSLRAENISCYVNGFYEAVKK